MSDKPKQPKPDVGHDVPKAPPPRPDTALITYIEHGQTDAGDKVLRRHHG